MQQPNESILDPNQLHFDGNFFDQVAEILQTICMTQNECEKIEKMRKDLEEKFSKIFKGCQVKLFGSIRMGLAFKNSDVDLFCDNCKEDLEHWLTMSHDYFSKNAKQFQVIEQSTNKKKIAVITFKHLKLKRRCDFSFNGPRAVYIAELVEHLLQMDYRAIQLMLLIKYWAKLHDLYDLNLPSIGLIFLVIFYLQIKRVLPTVATLQANLSPEIVDDWNVAFKRQINRSDNKESLFLLLGGFFEYFQYFNFAELAVSPYVGYPVERQKFLDVSKVPPEFQLYKERSYAHIQIKAIDVPMCIQDPFDHSRNITIKVKAYHLQKITEHFKYAATCHKHSRRNPKVFLQQILMREQELFPLVQLQHPLPFRRTRRRDRIHKRALQFAARRKRRNHNNIH